MDSTNIQHGISILKPCSTSQENVGALSLNASYKLVDGSNWNAKKAKVQTMGCARTSSFEKGSKRYSEQQNQFLSWAFNRGVSNPSLKLTAERAFKAMQLKGTAEGERLYPTEPEFYALRMARMSLIGKLC